MINQLKHFRTKLLHIEDVFIIGFCGSDQLKLSLTHDEVSIYNMDIIKLFTLLYEY